MLKLNGKETDQRCRHSNQRTSSRKQRLKRIGSGTLLNNRLRSLRKLCTSMQTTLEMNSLSVSSEKLEMSSQSNCQLKMPKTCSLTKNHSVLNYWKLAKRTLISRCSFPCSKTRSLTAIDLASTWSNSNICSGMKHISTIWISVSSIKRSKEQIKPSISWRIGWIWTP